MPRETFTMSNVLATSAREIAQNARRDADAARKAANAAAATASLAGRQAADKKARDAENRAKAVAKVVKEQGKAAEPAAKYEKPQAAMDKHRATQAAQKAAGIKVTSAPPKPIERPSSQDQPGAAAVNAAANAAGISNADVDKAKAVVKKDAKAAVDQYSDEFDARSEKEGLNDKDFQEYLLYNPDLREHAEALGLYGADAADWGRWHYYTFGDNENRANKPGNITNEDLKTAKWASPEIPQVYKDIGTRLGIPMNTLNDVFRYSVRSMTPSELWETRSGIDPEWNLAGRGGLLGEEGFDPTGWRYEADRPYAEGLLGGTLGLNKDLPGGQPVGQLVDEQDLKFIQDRFNDAFISGDFPQSWVNPQTREWEGPEGLGGYWNILTNAYRDENDILRSSVDRPPEGWFDYQPLTGLGPRGTIARGGVPFGQTVGGVGVGGAYAPTPYTQPAPQDWSDIRYTYAGNPLSELGQVTQTPASQAMFGPQGSAMQPWATGQQVPAGLLNYQIPGGAPANVGYSNPNLGLFDFGGAGAGAGAGAGTAVAPQVYNLPGGGTTTNFNAWQDAEYERMYPGRRAAAEAAGFAGLDYWKPGAAEWRASLVNGQIPQAEAQNGQQTVVNVAGRNVG